jgi:RNA polymerase sigma-70 factor (ECF subfamily)
MTRVAEHAESAQEFAHVYEQALPSVWQYVRSRIPMYQEAEDVTSEVFTSAWRSWPHYNSSRGSATAWLCGIAHRKVADWWRRPGRADRGSPMPDDPDAFLAGDLLLRDPAPEPDAIVLQEEQLAQLRHALGAMSERERDALALRFAAGLRAGEIGEIVGLSAGATKMMIWRALTKLRDLLAREARGEACLAPTEDERTADLLDEAIQGVLDRRRTAIPDPLLGRLVNTVAMVHQPPLPPEVAARVRACISCLSGEQRAPKGGFAHRIRALLARWGVPSASSLKAVTAPACVVCGVGNAAFGPLAAFGLHGILWALGPLNLVLLWRSFQQHRNPAALVLATAGVLLIFLHLTSHAVDIDSTLLRAAVDVSGRVPLGDYVIHPNMGNIPIGTALLLAGMLLDWRAQKHQALRTKLGYSV